MAATVANEPYERLAAFLASIEGLDDLLAGGFRHESPPGRAGFPCGTYRVLRVGANGEIDVEPTGYHRDAITIDLYGDDVQVLNDAARLINEAFDQVPARQQLHSENWLCLQVRQTVPWTAIQQRTRIKNESGENITQLSSDWEYRYARRQQTE